jgi:hypothetical protein
LDRPNDLQLTSLEHSIDFTKAAGLSCPTGKVLVEMLPPASSFRCLCLPEVLAANMRPDVGIVLACGPDVTLDPGDMVSVRGYAGQWLEEFAVDGLRSAVYETRNEVRVYGKYSPLVGTVFADPWSASIPIVIFPETGDMTATHNNLIVRRDPPVSRTGSLLVADYEAYRDGFAEVLAIGPKADLETRTGAIQVGDRIHYDTRGELQFAFGGDPDLAVIQDVAVNFKVSGQA